jgi:hypothetical protein
MQANSDCYSSLTHSNIPLHCVNIVSWASRSNLKGMLPIGNSRFQEGRATASPLKFFGFLGNSGTRSSSSFHELISVTVPQKKTFAPLFSSRKANPISFCRLPPGGAFHVQMAPWMFEPNLLRKTSGTLPGEEGVFVFINRFVAKMQCAVSRPHFGCGSAALRLCVSALIFFRMHSGPPPCLLRGSSAFFVLVLLL